MTKENTAEASGLEYSGATRWESSSLTYIQLTTTHWKHNLDKRVQLEQEETMTRVNLLNIDQDSISVCSFTSPAEELWALSHYTVSYPNRKLLTPKGFPECTDWKGPQWVVKDTMFQTCCLETDIHTHCISIQIIIYQPNPQKFLQRAAKY